MPGEIKFRTAKAKAAFNRTKILFTSKLDSNLRKKLAKCYIFQEQHCMLLKLGHFRK
jgi:hypothetical protein